MHGRGACMAGGMCGAGGVCVVVGGHAWWWGGHVCVTGGIHSRRCECKRDGH